MNSRADALALFLRIDDAFQAIEEPVGSIHANHVEAQALAQQFESVLEFVAAKQAVIDKYVGQPVANGAMYQSGGDGRSPLLRSARRSRARLPLAAGWIRWSRR